MSTIFGVDKPVYTAAAVVTAVVGLGLGFTVSGGLEPNDDADPSAAERAEDRSDEDAAGSSSTVPSEVTLDVQCEIARGTPTLDLSDHIDFVGVQEAGAGALAEALDVSEPLILPEGTASQKDSIAGHDERALARIESPRTGVVLVRDGVSQSAFASRAVEGWVVVVVAGPSGNANDVSASDVIVVRAAGDDRKSWTLDETAAENIAHVLRSGDGCTPTTGENR